MLTGHAEFIAGSGWQLISPPDCEQRPVCCTWHNTDVGKMTEFFTGSPVQGMAVIPVMFLVKELDDFIICVSVAASFWQIISSFCVSSIR